MASIGKHVDGATGHADFLRNINGLSVNLMNDYAQTEPKFVSKLRHSPDEDKKGGKGDQVKTDVLSAEIDYQHEDDCELDASYEMAQAEEVAAIMADSKLKMYLDNMRYHIERQVFKPGSAR